jgi:hypothetical protein
MLLILVCSIDSCLWEIPSRRVGKINTIHSNEPFCRQYLLREVRYFYLLSGTEIPWKKSADIRMKISEAIDGSTEIDAERTHLNSSCEDSEENSWHE